MRLAFMGEEVRMRVAIYADVHGNATALDAVLADIDAAGGVDAHWVTGDVTDMGAEPVRCIARLQELPELAIVRGNGDLAVVKSDAGALAARLPDVSLDDARLELMYLEAAAWARGAITAAGQFAWLAALPLEVRATLPDGTRVLLVHASPGTDEGTGMPMEQSDDEVRALLRRADADLVLAGHTHIPLDRTVDGIRVFNTGSVSNPVTDDQRAMWTLLDADESGYRFDRRFVAYDRERYLDQVASLHHPAEAKIRAFFA
ncbi:MAG: metallophosphatase family protein [Chloroflexota bacterium]|nr:metallophosphatase family protein [Chloroflexota bacterium]